MDILNKTVDINYFNNLLMRYGGKKISSNKNNIKMRIFILKLVKIFEKDFKKNKKGGDTNNGLIENSMKYDDLSFNGYTFPQYSYLERDEL